MQFDLVIFDCDGVLVDSEMLSVRADLECLAEHGVDLSADEILERYTGARRTIRACARKAPRRSSATDRKRLRRVCRTAPSLVPRNGSSG